MQGKGIWRLSVVMLSLGLILGFTLFAGAQELTVGEQLGKSIFFDKKLSVRKNQSCASCHAPISGFSGPIPGINLRGAVYFGSIRTAFGNRRPPTATYATTSPRFDYDSVEGLFFGGNFWDGRATGWDLGNPAADQARGPFLNPVEQALPDQQAVVERVCSSSYASLFEAVWGPNACNESVDVNYSRVALSIAEYEASGEVNQFSSKYDAVMFGQAEFTAQELMGFELFRGNAQCVLCHVMDGAGPGGQDLFTDYTFDNLGVPKNPLKPFYDTDPAFVDNGLGHFLRSLTANGAWRTAPFVTPAVIALTDVELSFLASANDGKHKVPTLRNVDKSPGPGFVKSFGHNGYFKSLEGIVHFYNTRDVKDTCPGDYTEQEALAANCWPAPAVAANVNTAELGDLGLSAAEEAAIVAFMKTLSDGYIP
jgi:cytochrome c peroxidase